MFYDKNAYFALFFIRKTIQQKIYFLKVVKNIITRWRISWKTKKYMCNVWHSGSGEKRV